jgi:hypothetical protein
LWRFLITWVASPMIVIYRADCRLTVTSYEDTFL